MSLERIGMLKGREEEMEGMKGREKVKSLRSWWMASTSTPLPSQHLASPTLHPLWFSAPRTESYHGLGVRSSSSGGRKNYPESEFTIQCVVLLICFFNASLQF